MSKRRISGVVSGALAAGALLLGLPSRAAFAAEPTTPAEARSLAVYHADLAAQFRGLGASGYKTGLVQREEAAAARYDVLADQLAAAQAPAGAPEPAPAAPAGTPMEPNPNCMADKPVAQLGCQ